MCSMRESLDHGRFYVGIIRPKDYRKRAKKRCFYNAVHHAWVTLDGVHAIDVTWDDPPDCHYFGIAFPKEIVSRYGYSQGSWVSMLSEDKPSAALRALLDPA
jgi:hypothetical protein